MQVENCLAELAFCADASGEMKHKIIKVTIRIIAATITSFLRMIEARPSKTVIANCSAATRI